MHHHPSAHALMEPGHGPAHVVETRRTNGFAAASDGSSLRQPPAPSPPENPSTYLAPGDLFPGALAELDLVELQVLHSRIARQLDSEYRTDPDGPHPVSLDRAQELVAELDTRQEFLDDPHPAPAPAEVAFRGRATRSEEAAGPGPAPAKNTAGTRTRKRPPTASRQHGEGNDGLFSRRGESACAIDVRIEALDRLWPGDRIEVWHGEQLDGVGIVELAAPALGVLWIRDALDGYRRMLHLDDAVLRYHLPAVPPRPAS